MTDVVAFEQVTITRGDRVVLSAVDLAIAQDRFVAVLGANGSGKTTLMRAIVGLTRPRSGAVRVLDRPASRGNAAIGYIPQVRSLLGGLRLRGRDFVAGVVNGQRWGLPLLGRRGRAEVRWALERVGAKELANRPLAETSGGERQRLLLAQALLGRPRLLLLDEPLISLDPSHQQTVVRLVRELQQDLGITVLFSAHELNPLLNAIDQVLYLGQGQAALGSVDEVITGPVLSRLYGSPIEVVRLHGRIFVMSGAYEVERGAHRHDV